MSSATPSYAPMDIEQRISITLQHGNHRELVVIERSEQAHILHPLTCITQLGNGSVVEVIVVDRNEVPTRPHIVEVNTYLTPTFCDYCGEILVGLVKQGLQCQRCRCNFHKKCAFASRNNCARNTSVAGPPPVMQQQAYATQQMPQYPQTPMDDSPSAMVASPYALPHTLAVHNYKTLTVCKVCDKMLFGIMKQGLRCRDCKVNVHKKCAALLPQNCHIADGSITAFEQLSVSEQPSVSPQDEPSEANTSIDSDLIPLSRIPGQAAARHANKQAHEGWMIHFLLNEPQRRLRHYWMLSNNVLSLYNEYSEGVGVNPTRCYRQIPLSEILAITPYNGDPVDPRFPPHVFEMRTTSNAVYCVGENLDSYGGPPTKLPRGQAARSSSSGQVWLGVLARALQPPPSRSDPANAEPALQFTELYQVLSEKTLGAGQFGTVYTGVHRQSGREVAVKVISKERFSKKPNNGADTLRSEVAILQTISHQGIVRLESMFETKDKIFVVMEKMNGDMLEMILSQASGRLDERVTRFLILQIMSALRYLHNKGIAHCDLKPENVLLSELSSNFPQTKLCDFGYARFIGESQFRKTIVGTPAYLPPEVLQKRGYNKSLDMWSVGVIIYVTLSGTFPFNDGEEISDQIQNAAFMFPQDPWAQVSREAVDLIQRLLRVNIEERLHIEECLAHQWLQSGELFSDLRALELRLGGERYLTNGQDDAHYAQLLLQQQRNAIAQQPSLLDL
ncbi:unnamed protein product, partial [Mesorhabditis spiculigera]